MKIVSSIKIGSFLLMILLSVSTIQAQKGRVVKPAPTKAKPVIFAVLFDGKTIEPIGFIEKGKLVEPPGGDSESKILKSFAGIYYKPKTKYDLIFGSGTDGKVEIIKSSIGECSGNSAEVTVRPVKAKLKGFVMALATNAPVKAKSSTVRRLPTATERAEIEKLVRAEFVKQSVPSAVLKELRYHNLTAVDVDNDGKVELIGSFWVAPKADERDLLFFIAEKGGNGKYLFTHSDYSANKPEDLMSGDVKDLDTMGGELLLDVLDYDNDGVSEIFTTTQAFEGRNFAVYRRETGKWTKTFESYNYRCGY